MALPTPSERAYVGSLVRDFEGTVAKLTMGKPNKGDSSDPFATFHALNGVSVTADTIKALADDACNARIDVEIAETKIITYTLCLEHPKEVLALCAWATTPKSLPPPNGASQTGVEFSQIDNVDPVLAKSSKWQRLCYLVEQLRAGNDPAP
jgi:hypothetical protein